MKRNRQQDWTEILQDRLQDARLPVRDAWDVEAYRMSAASRQETKAFSDHVPARTWTWALAGAVAVVAAVVLLRPAHRENTGSVRLVEIPADALRETGTLLVQGIPAPAPIPAFVRNSRPEEITHEEAPQRDQDGRMLDQEKEKQAPETTSPGRAASPAMYARPLSEQAEADFRQEARRDRQPLRLRIQAGAGTQNTGKTGLSYQGLSYHAVVVHGDPVANSSSSERAGKQDPGFDLPPVSLGLSLAVPLTRQWELAVGLDYTRRRAFWETYAPSLQERDIYHYNLQYLGVPLDVHYYINPGSHLRAYLGAGAKAEVCIGADKSAVPSHPVLFSWSLQAGADLRIAPRVRVYLTPSLVQYFNRSIYSAAWDSEPQLLLHAGFLFEL